MKFKIKGWVTVPQGRYDGPPKPQEHEKTFYPKYDEFEVMPGESENKDYDKWKDFKNPYFDESTNKAKK